MTDNVLIKFSHHISANLSDSEIILKVIKSLEEVESIYSYLIHAKYKDNVLTEWIIQYMISQQEEFNTLKVKDIIPTVTKQIIENKNTVKTVISYKQPSIEVMLKLYEPLIRKLAIEQCNNWPELEYEDAVSICRMTMFKLYKAGYYIHKHLLRKAFIRDILMSLRKSRNKPETVSIYEIIYVNGMDNDPVTLEDMLPDKQIDLQNEEEEEENIKRKIFEEVKQILIEYFGERQFDQLFRDYGNKHTTEWSRKKMIQVKELFKKLGLDYKTFRRYYE